MQSFCMAGSASSAGLLAKALSAVLLAARPSELPCTSAPVEHDLQPGPNSCLALEALKMQFFLIC